MHSLLLVALVLADLPIQPPAESPALVVFEGRIGPPEPGRSAAADLELDVAGERLRFQVSRVRVLRGSFLGADLLAELSPHRPSLYLRGPDELLQKLKAATPDVRVELTGYHRTGSRDLLVSDVKITPHPAHHLPLPCVDLLERSDASSAASLPTMR